MVKTATPEAVLIYTTPTAARILGVSRQTVWNWLNDGTLEEVQWGGRTRVVKADSVEALKAKRQTGAVS